MMRTLPFCLVGAMSAVVSAQGANERTVSKAQYGERWPLTVDGGVIACTANAATFRAAGRTWALNGIAKSRMKGAGAIVEIQRRQPPKPVEAASIVSRVPELQRMAVFESAVTCEDQAAKSVNSMTDFVAQSKEQRRLTDACEARLLTRSKISKKELGQISTEGVLRNWPPLKIMVSVGPLIDDALKLCR